MAGRKVTVADAGELRELVLANAESIEPGLTIVKTGLQLGRATVDAIALDAHQSVVLIAFGAADETLVAMMDAWAWCLVHPETLRGLSPSVNSERAPRLLILAERVTDKFVQRAQLVSMIEVTCVEYRLFEVNGQSVVCFDPVEISRVSAPGALEAAPPALETAPVISRPADPRPVEDDGRHVVTEAAPGEWETFLSQLGVDGPAGVEAPVDASTGPAAEPVSTEEPAPSAPRKGRNPFRSILAPVVAAFTDEVVPDPTPGPIPDQIPDRTPEATPEPIPEPTPEVASAPAASARAAKATVNTKGAKAPKSTGSKAAAAPAPAKSMSALAAELARVSPKWVPRAAGNGKGTADTVKGGKGAPKDEAPPEEPKVEQSSVPLPPLPTDEAPEPAVERLQLVSISDEVTQKVEEPVTAEEPDEPVEAPKPVGVDISEYLRRASGHPALESLNFPKEGLSRQWLDFLNQLAAKQ